MYRRRNVPKKGSGEVPVDRKEKSPTAKVHFLSTRAGFRFTLLVLICARLLSAAFNIIHDCDETFNYWEPLHFLLYKKGFQTWEYSPLFALRSYLYIIAHYIFAKPLAVIATHSSKLFVFFGVRVLLGFVSAFTEACLVHAASKTRHHRESCVLLCLLATSASMFISSTSFLPGTFSMYCFTLATAGVLSGRTNVVIIACATSVILGWSVTAIAAVPYALWVLVKGDFLKSLRTAVVSAVILLGSTFALDSFFYGRYSLSLYSFLSYNVFGSGDSALYGVENSTYYLRNGALSLNMLLPLSLLAPLFMLGKWCYKRKDRSAMGSLFVACSPQWVWLAAITYLPHKEERFMYVVYPQILYAAAYCIVEISRLIPRLFISKRRLEQSLIKTLLVVAAFLCTSILSASRVGALLWNYSAHMRVYRDLQSLDQARLDGPCTVCLGSEWYEFPSHFFVPEQCEVHFLDSGFRGILPAAFNDSRGGTRYGASYLNDRNEADKRQFIVDESSCNVMVSLKYDEKLEPKELNRGVKNKRWEIVQEHKYVQGNLSAALFRALFIPFLSPQKLVYNYYALYASNKQQ